MAIDTPDDVPQVAEARHREEWAGVLAPVSVAWDGHLAAELRMSETDRDRRARCVVALEHGSLREWAEPVDQLPVGAVADVDGRRHVLGRLSAPWTLPTGYHRLIVEIGDRSAESVVIAAPTEAFECGGGGVGLFLPLHALHSARSWGVGDFSDLERLLDWLPSTGGRVLSMLPILAADYDGDPCNPSPYLPVSRLFWNELFVDPRRVPEFAECDAARRLVASDRFCRRVGALQAARLIDYPGALAAKRDVLALLADTLESQPNRRSEEFHEWVRRNPLADAYASFRGARGYHLYAQWVTAQQVEQVAARARTVGDGLFLDFPIGVHPGGFDVSHYAGVFARGVTTGAPPDELFTEGQNWGTRPPHPAADRLDGYRYLRASLARHLSVADRLRIDHVMGIHRLYWIPQGGDPTDGVYVHYPADEVYAVLCLESWRHRTRLVGENLGTVQPSVHTALARHRVGGLYVAQYQVRADTKPPLAPVPSDAVATLNTHDTATFAGYLDGTDIDDRVSRGRLAPRGAARAHARRRQERAALARLPPRGPAAPDEASRLLRSSLLELAQSAAELVLVNLEDLWLERRSQNVPGTGPERSNWRHRARLRLEVLTATPEVTDTLRAVTAARPPRTGAGATPERTS